MMSQAAATSPTPPVWGATPSGERPPLVNSPCGGHMAPRLAACLHGLSERDRTFAESLLAGHARYHRFTDRQRPHVARLILAAEAAIDGTASAPAPRTITGFERVVEMFDAAGSALRNPKVRLAATNGLNLVLSIAKAHHKEPGTINVIEAHNGTWYGRIRRNGTFQPTTRDVPSLASTRDFLLEFAAAPEATARAYGRNTGTCCCCGRELTDPASISAGIGPVCATRFGL